MYSQSQHHLRAHCSYKSHIPQTNSLFSWLWVSKIALHRQQGWGLSDARNTWGKTHEVSREMLWQSKQHSYPATSSAWPLPITTLPTPGCLTELLHTRCLFSSSTQEIVFPVQLARCRRACPEKTNVPAPPTAQELQTSEQVTHMATTTRRSHSLGSLSFLRKCLPKLCQKHLTCCRKVTGSPLFGSWTPACYHLQASKQWGGLSREFLHDYCLLSKPSPHSS